METRRAFRVDLELIVKCRIDESQRGSFRLIEGDQFDTQAIDISEKGVRVLSRYLIPRGLVLELDIDGKLFGLGHNIKTKSEVRYCETLKGLRKKNRLGLMFLDISEEDRQAIARFVSSNERREHTRIQL